jgi:protein TonB
MGKWKSTVAIFGFGLSIVFGSHNAAAQDTLQDSAQKDVVLTAKPRPAYTDVARKKEFQGTVVLRVELLSNGSIGQIEDVTKKHRKKLIKYGLTAAAIDAAKKIKFEPARRRGVPVTVMQTVEYNFNIY